jgi:bacterioferritin
MKGDSKILLILNQVLFNELTAINQYYLHAKMFQHWGLSKLADFEKRESIDEMKHADMIMERILFLEGLPNLQHLGKLLIGETPQEMLQCDLKLENIALPTIKEGITYAEEIQDYVTRDLLQRIMNNEEEHIDWLEKQFDLIQNVGLQNYLQSQI